jgi:hypothetical protein
LRSLSGHAAMYSLMPKQVTLIVENSFEGGKVAATEARRVIIGTTLAENDTGTVGGSTILSIRILETSLLPPSRPLNRHRRRTV